MNREKKQLIAVGAMVVMILGIGAFQMMQGSGAPPPAPTEAKKESELEEDKDKKPEIKNPEVASPLRRRDPFMMASFANDEEAFEVPAPVAPKPEVKRPKVLPGRPSHSNGHTKFEFDGDELPVAGSLNERSEGPKPIVPEVKFGYTLIGILDGVRDVAVFQDAAGNQRMVPVGQAIDGDATLLSVSRGSVRVKFHAQTLVLTIGENSK
jgi:hypothetical protein